MARKKGSKDYPIEIKLEAIRLWQEEGLPQKEITERLVIRDPSRVKIWLRIYIIARRDKLNFPRKNGQPVKGNL